MQREPRRDSVSSCLRVSRLQPESDTERRILADPRWQAGTDWGSARPGHPEGKVIAHIEQVLANIDEANHDPDTRSRLRFIALLHDTFKREVDSSRPRSGDNHHATIARRFAERYTKDPDLLDVIELHDEAYNSWAIGTRSDDWVKARMRAYRLLDRLGARLPLYLDFYRADNAAGDKLPEPLEWFDRVAQERKRTT
jgi:hypothetical protein